MSLLERDEELEKLHTAITEAGDGRGRLVLVRGEAGIGKTSLLNEFARSQADVSHVLFGACDDLTTPRPLEAFWDMADSEPDIASALTDGDAQNLFRVVYDLLDRRARPTTLIVDDAHWADQATLDLVRKLGRRVDRLHGVLVLSFREEDTPADHPMRVMVGDIPPASIIQLRLQPLSKVSVATLAGTASGKDLWEKTGGNPLLVTEALRFEAEVPDTIVDMVAGRVARLSPAARSVVELVSVVPTSCRLALAKKCVPIDPDVLDECEQSGLLVVTPDRLSFRHELIRRAVETGLSAGSHIDVNQKWLDVLETEHADPARLLHHAKEAGDNEAVLRHAPSAAEAAMSARSYREARGHLESLEPMLDRLDIEEQAWILNMWSEVESKLGNIPRALQLKERAAIFYGQLGDELQLGEALRVLSYLRWRTKQSAASRESATRSVELIERSGSSDRVALALADKTWIDVVHGEVDEARTSIAAAHRAAEDSKNDQALAYVCAVEAWTAPRGPDALRTGKEALQMARASGSEEAERRVHSLLIQLDTIDTVSFLEQSIDEAHQFADDHDIDDVEAFARTGRAFWHLRTGLLGMAEDEARRALEIWEAINDDYALYAMLVVGLAQVRRGSPQAVETLQSMAALAMVKPERSSHLHLGLAQAHWLNDQIPFDIDWVERHFHSLEPARDGLREQKWLNQSLTGLYIWLWLLGYRSDDLYDQLTPPERHLVDGNWEASAEGFAELEMPFEQAVALYHGDTKARIKAVEILDGIGAMGLSDRIRRELRDEGVSGVPVAPRQSVLDGKAGLTDRQFEVLELLAQGMTNAQIADTLFISPRTAEHHVAAVISKLGARTRVEASELAIQRGILRSSG